MSGIKRWRLLEFVVTAGICLLPIVAAATPQARNEGGAAQEEILSLIRMALTTARDGDQAKLKEIAHGLMIPNYDTWFKTTFGEEDGVKMAAAYKKGYNWEEDWLPKMFEGLAKEQGEWLVEKVSEPLLPGAMPCQQTLGKAAKNGAAFYWVSLHMTASSGTNYRSPAGYYALVEGAYRRLDCGGVGLGIPGGVASGGPALGPLRVGGNVQAARIINRVQPEYPKQAVQERISGTVRLHVLISKDGTVEMVEVVSGHPMLQQTALDAVRQWTYQPTLLNGNRIRVDTTVDVLFSLDGVPSTNP